MNFTREPIIETVITPREGCKLVIRSSKGNGAEDFYVDAIEVVSFGQSIFYRSTERPKSFLLPVSDYEVIELKETRMVLKTGGAERSIKIGGGKESRPAREEEEETPAAPHAEKPQPQQQQHESHQDRKRDKRRSRRRRGGMEHKEEMIKPESKPESAPEEAPVSSSTISRLFPPPPTLIKDKLGRYKDSGVLEANLLPEKSKTLEEPFPGDVLEFNKGEAKEEKILPEDLEPNTKEPPDEPIFPESSEENQPPKE